MTSPVDPADRGKQGHSAPVLARKLGASRHAYRSLQVAHIALHRRYEHVAAERGRRFNELSEARGEWINEKNRLEYRVAQKVEALDDLRGELRRARWMRFLWLLVGIASHDLWMRIF